MIRYAVKPNGTGWAVTRTVANFGDTITTTESWHRTEADARREASLKASWEHVVAADAGWPVPDVVCED
jgi:P2-related tail formation protein